MAFMTHRRQEFIALLEREARGDSELVGEALYKARAPEGAGRPRNLSDVVQYIVEHRDRRPEAPRPVGAS